MKPSKRLTRKQVTDLFIEYRRTRSVELRNTIAESFMGLVTRTAVMLGERLAPHIDVEELIAFGMPGLIWSVEHFDPDNGAAFTTFATRRIHGAMMDEIRELDHVPRLTRGRARRISNASNTFYAEHGRRPTSKELQTSLGLDDYEFRKIAGDEVVSMTSLSDAITSPDAYECEMLATAIPARDDVEPGTIPDAHNIIREIVVPMFGVRAGLLLRLRYIDGLTMREVGEALRVGESRISQMTASLMRSVRARVLNTGGRRAA